MDDVKLLVDHFIKRYCTALDKRIHGISDNALSILNSYHWPGNVRELEHLIERAVVLCQGTTITTGDLPQDLTMVQFPPEGTTPQPPPKISEARDYPIPPVPESGYQSDAEGTRILEILAKCGGNKAKAARLLGIDRSTLYRKIRDFELDLSVIELE